MIDIAIVGCGPAGMSAAINVYSRNKMPMIFSRDIETSALYKAEKVNNHLGMPDMSGKQMIYAFYNQIDSLGIKIRTGRMIQIISSGGLFMLNFENEFLQAKSVIIATGIGKTSKIKGASELLGKGVSYCATCDGMLYRDKTVAVVAETEEGLSDAEFLAGVCSKVYLLNYSGKPSPEGERIILPEGKISEIKGTERVEGIVVNGETIDLAGVFIVGETPPLSSLVQNLDTDKNAIKVNSKMETNIPGLYACGDATGGPYQVSKAVGEGLIAGQAAAKYVSQKN